MERPKTAARHSVLLLGIFAAGCAAGPESEVDGVRMPAVGLDAPPGFEVGDTFQFDNPDVSWKVVAIENGRAQWESDAGDAQVTDMNPLLPELEWTSETQGSGKRLISNVQGKLFPLEVGSRTTFKSTVSMDRPPYAWEADWACEVTGVRQIEVPAGNFATFDVICTRAGVDENRFSYAPDLGHWVVSTTRERADAPPRSRQLVSFTKARASTLVIGTDPAGETVISAEAEPKKPLPPMPTPEADPVPEVQVPNPMATARPEQRDMEVVSVQPPQTPAGKKPAARASVAVSALPNGAGGYGLHIASYKNQSNVDPGWRALKQRYGNELGAFDPVVKRVDLGEKGVFYRLMAGPIRDRANAVARCRALSKRGQYCKVIAL